jgi:hypothetical protein
MNSIDKLLAEIKAEYEEVKPEQQQQQPQPSTAKSFIKPPSKSASLIDNLLAEVQADFVEKDAAEDLRKQQEVERKRIQEEQLKAKQREALQKVAKDWLVKLDPLSPEGLWFERFAEGYPSKLDAAIEYLQTNE